MKELMINFEKFKDYECIYLNTRKKTVNIYNKI